MPTHDIQSVSPATGGGAPSARQSPENREASVKGRPFGEVLNSQESSTETSSQNVSESSLPSESGKPSQESGKSLPDQVISGQELARALNDNLPEEQPDPAISSTSAPHAIGTSPAVPVLPMSRGTQQLADVLQKFLGNSPETGGDIETADHLDVRLPRSVGLRENGPISGLQQTLTAGKASVALGEATDIEMRTSQAAWLRDAEFNSGLQQALTAGKAETALDSTEKFVNLETGLQKIQLANLPVSASAIAFGGAMLPTSETGLLSGLKALPAMSITTPLGASGWDSEFAGRMSVMIKSGVQEASLQLSPPELGRLEIKISTDGDLTKVMFAVENASAREAIEQAMPRLREMLEQGGLQLAQSEVFDHSQSQQGKDKITQLAGASASTSGEDVDTEDEHLMEFGISTSSSTVDYYI